MSLLKYGWIYILLTLFPCYVQSEIEFNTATWYWFYFHNKGKCELWRQVLQKEQDQQLSLTQYCVSAPSYCCPELFYSLTRVLFFFTLQYIMFYSAVLKSTSPTHFNKPFKLLYESEMCSAFATPPTSMSLERYYSGICIFD